MKHGSAEVFVKLYIQHILALLPPPKYTKTLLYNHLGIQLKQLRPLNVFAVSKVRP